MSTVLITGAGSGFGRLATEALIHAGHQVIGSMRDLSGRNRAAARELIQLGAQVLEIDVTDDASTQRGVEQAISQIGVIDVLINNAGLGALGMQEGFTSDDWKKVFDVNVFGVQRMIRAVLPHMKERKHGLLIQIASLTGRLAIPFQGPYSPSKWAVEALAELYKVEVSQFGIESCIIEPGGFPTPFLDRLMEPSDRSRLASYGDLAQMPEDFRASFEQVFAQNPAQNPAIVADAIVDLIGQPHGQRPFRTVVDKMGLGERVHNYNEHLEKITTEIYSQFGIEHLLRVKN